MPLGFERLNERTQRPNPLINFIKPLPGSSSATAHTFLSRVAAICYPFMKTHHIAVMSLEEFPPNNEFIGRNFNAGEVIQLVLKNRAGGWLPMRHVQMVMVHELAHCKEMNHSRAFWKVRDAYARELKGLWGRGYTGDGVWGPGRNLLGEEIESGSVDEELVPEHLCGGTYGSRRGKRRRGLKEKEAVSYAERKQRRILKKFGAGGKLLGDDADMKVKLEGGAVKKGKPRVAGSARGRELRAAAALARFDQVKEEVKVKEDDSGSETDNEYDETDDGDAATDVDGTKMVDGKGHSLVKICGDEDDEDGNTRRELAEIHEVDDQSRRTKTHTPSTSTTTSIPRIESSTVNKHKAKNKSTASVKDERLKSNVSKSPSLHAVLVDETHKRRSEPKLLKLSQQQESRTAPKLECPVCSLIHESGALTCAVCSNVLDINMVPDHWRCKSSSCLGGAYVNAGDAGICGVCGIPKPT
ncbi:WLM-domain-containing protein [Lepidopterella palustris CBS 459.81]|uniref:WLM-domain-containing protein n=1 Tax=Lepidopterella palustris CBS 459.81 TaxID=1314670 RepID=A0A8E2JCE1_9PEZI|nr:WLM-domain-containing protein [Lepidopterella palustris CBS 459.81]